MRGRLDREVAIEADEDPAPRRHGGFDGWLTEPGLAGSLGGIRQDEVRRAEAGILDLPEGKAAIDADGPPAQAAPHDLVQHGFLGDGFIPPPADRGRLQALEGSQGAEVELGRLRQPDEAKPGGDPPRDLATGVREALPGDGIVVALDVGGDAEHGSSADPEQSERLAGRKGAAGDRGREPTPRRSDSRWSV